jgi:predicted permease
VVTTLDRLRDVPVGVDTSRVLTAAVSLPQGSYPDAASQGTFWTRVVERVGAMPGVQAVSLSDSRPPSEVGQENNINLEDHPTPAGKIQPTSPWVGVTPDYFKTVGLTLQEGRLLDVKDSVESAPSVVVVDRGWADRFFPNERVLGRRFHEGGCTTCDWTTVVGIVGTVKYLGLSAPDQGTVYWPIAAGDRNRFILLRSDRPAALASSLRQVIREMDPTLPTFNVRSMKSAVDASIAQLSFTMVILGVAAAVTLILGVIGLYGVIAYVVTLRTRELGVRIALGAQPLAVAAMVTKQGLVLSGAGIVIGLGLVAVVARFLRSFLFEVAPTDPAILASATAVLIGFALLASWIPARRAARVNPIEALRSD